MIKLVTGILEQEFPTDSAYYSTEDLKNFMHTYKGPANIFLIAEEGGRIVGTCGVKADDQKSAILRRLFVDPQHRGFGIGTKLLTKALQFCRSRGYQEAVIRTSARMERAIRLCQSLGFQEDGQWDMGSVTLVRYRLRVT